jgi:hypothetical protein
MVDNDRDGGREPLRGYFEFFKHLSTLSTLVLVVVLVLYRDLYLDPVLALVALAAFGVSALASFYGMFVAMGGSYFGTPPRGLLYVAAGGLVGAVLCLIAGIAAAGVF